MIKLTPLLEIAKPFIFKILPVIQQKLHLSEYTTTD